MTAAAPVESPTHVVKPLDPKSVRGRDAAAALGQLHAAVIERLRSEGKPVPGDPSP